MTKLKKQLKKARRKIREHLEPRTVSILVDYPEHDPREGESAEFDHNRHLLIERMGVRCLACETGQCEGNLEVHHLVEWSLWNAVDPAKMLKLLRRIDFYGFGHLLRKLPIRSPDDIRNLLVLCAKHHRERNFGIHNGPWPPWLANTISEPGKGILKAPTKGKKR